jgi:hypothetical protein
LVVVSSGGGVMVNVSLPSVIVVGAVSDGNVSVFPLDRVAVTGGGDGGGGGGLVPGVLLDGGVTVNVSPPSVIVVGAVSDENVSVFPLERVAVTGGGGTGG